MVTVVMVDEKRFSASLSLLLLMLTIIITNPIIITVIINLPSPAVVRLCWPSRRMSSSSRRSTGNS